MKILWLNWYDPEHPRAGGAEVHLLEVAKRLVALGHAVHVLACGWPGADATTAIEGVTVDRVGTQWWRAHHILPRRARALLREREFDVLLDDVNKVPFKAPIWSPIPVVAFFHHLIGETAYRDYPYPIARWFLYHENRIAKHYQGAVCAAPSQSTANELLASGLKAHSLSVIENGVDSQLYKPLPEPIAGPQKVLMVSRLRRYKRVGLGLEAAALLAKRIPDLRITVVGQGPDFEALNRQAFALGLRADFLGHISEERKIAELQRASVFIAPSEKEGWGLTCVEAMACGTPVVATDVPGHRDAIQPGTGLLVPASPEKIAAGCEKVMRDRSITSNGLRRARSLTWDSSTRHLESLLSYWH